MPNFTANLTRLTARDVDRGPDHPAVVATFIAGLADPERRADSETLIALMQAATGAEPHLEGSGVAFGRYHFRYASGREGDASPVGFAPTPRVMTVYLLSGMVGYDDLLAGLGRFRRGKVCLYIRRLADIDIEILEALIRRCVAHLEQVETELGTNR